MTHFEYISVLVSILIAFAISELLAGWAGLLRARERVRFYWLHGLWCAFLLLLVVQLWHGFWEYRSLPEWSYFAILGVVFDFLPPLVMMVLLVPSTEGARAVDLRAHYFGNRGPFFGIGAFSMLSLAFFDASIGHQPVWHPENAVRALGFALALALALSPSERLHAAVGALAFPLLAVFATVSWRTGG